MASTSTDDPPVAMAQPNDDEEERTEMWEGQAVPFPVFKALSTAYRGQHIGPEGLKVLANPGVPDEVKLEICKKAYAKSAKEWLDAYETRKRKAASLDEETFLHAERELIDESNPAALRRSQRQSVLDARTVDTIEKKEMRTTMLDEVYEEALESTAARLKSKPGKKTLGLDGKTNIRGRGTINVTECKQGINTYVKTVYCGAREHSGQLHADIAKEILGDGRQHVAVVADNTGNMRTMFRILSGLYAFLFMIGCVVHVLDLLVEDIAKISEISGVVADYHFIITFTKRYSLLYEAFMTEQTKRYGKNTISLRLFPLTRFAYVYLMLFTALRNWTVLADLPDLPEYKLTKQKYGRPNRKGSVPGDFARFEKLVGSRDVKAEGSAALALLQPLTLTLSFLEGDSVPPSYIIPLYAMLYQCFSREAENTDAVLALDTLQDAANCVKYRWLGKGRKVGLRADFHCLCFMLDPFVRAAIVAVFGKTQLRRYDEAFTVENVQAAILNWNGGKNDSRYARLLAEYEKYSGRVGDYSSKLTTAENIVRTRLAKDVLPTITAEDKENKAMHLLRVLQGLCKISLAPTFWASIENSSTATPDCILFCKMAIECHMVVPHAIGVERVNKNADIVHCKRRASMGEITSVKAIYAYSNLYLEFEGKHTFDRFCEEVMSREEIESMYDGFEDVVDATAPNLPAVDNSDSSEDEDASADEEYGESLLEDDEDEWEEEPLEVPEGFTALPLPVALLQGKDLQHVHVLMKWEATSGEW
ncbi:hypothetical protein CYMTET_45462 [Cymbomonas tetramitiformis]|uniref:DUF659 domain-containing protein n=1 Tax=Cymbomonas tetramitiformis TaxID=36881 RepID=A0AAE0BZG6_9CHLO|nr:hypothetical protein CYMTET_45462 [Cymbomonas tetramitiformis]